MLRSLGAICGTGVPAVLQHLDVHDQLLKTCPLIPRGRASFEVQQHEVKKPRCERYTQPGNQRREPLVAFPIVSHLLPLHQLLYLLPPSSETLRIARIEHIAGPMAGPMAC